MKCKVTASLLFYNKRTYSKGEYIEVVDSKMDMFIREHLAKPCPIEPKPEQEALKEEGKSVTKGRVGHQQGRKKI